MSARRLAQLRAALPYTGGQAKIALRRMIAELEADLAGAEIAAGGGVI